MPFVKELLNYKSCSIVGIEKNTGKTECFNYVMQNLPTNEYRIAVSSIGIDGETTDQVTMTAKPEIFLPKDVYFATSRKHYLSRRLSSELLEITDELTPLGNILIGKSLTPGKVLLSGPSSSNGLKRWINEMKKYEVDLIIVDGALSRMSLASPAVTESMILATGAAYSANINNLVQKTSFVVQMINLELTSKENYDTLFSIHNGAVAIDTENQLHDLGIRSSLSLNINTEGIKKCKTLYLSGALTDTFLNSIRQNKIFEETEIVVRDFTKIFLTPAVYNSFVNDKRKITVLQKSKLIAICVNPTSPNGIILNSEKLCETLSEAVKLPVYDLKKIQCN